MNNKKGDLIVNITIVFILALLVLGLTSYFLLRGGSSFSKGTSACTARLGTCVAEETCDGQVIEGAGCSKGTPTCCLRLGGESK